MAAKVRKTRKARVTNALSGDKKNVFAALPKLILQNQEQSKIEVVQSERAVPNEVPAEVPSSQKRVQEAKTFIDGMDDFLLRDFGIEQREHIVKELYPTLHQTLVQVSSFQNW